MNSTNKKIKIFLSCTILFTSAALIWIGSTPSITEEPFFLNFSIQRFLLFCLVSLILLFTVFSLIFLRNEKYASFWVSIFKSKWVFIFAICSTLITGVIVLGTPLQLFRENTFLLQRILPVNCLLFLISLDLLISQHLFSNGKLIIEIKKIFTSIVVNIEKGFGFLFQNANKLISTPLGSITFLIMVNAPIIFINAIKFDYPLGFSGLYALMSEELVNSKFRLPSFVPFYGPGGIPFAYPPIGFYIMGFFVGILKVPSMVFLRFMPAIYYLSATLLFYLLVKKVSNSPLAGIISSVIIAYSSVNFEIQSTSGGIVRGLALVFLLLCLLAYFKSPKRLIWKSLLVGLYFALTLLTHLGYGFILGLILVALTFSKPFAKNGWILLFYIGFFTIILSAPWWITMVSRYGFDVFSNAFGSHGNSYLMLILSGEKPLLPWLKISFGTFYQNPLFGGVALVGILFLLFTGNFGPFLIFFLLMLFSEENGRYLIMLGAAAIGVLLSKINNLLSVASSKLQLFFRITILTFFIFLIIFPEGKNILNIKPLISKEVFTLAEYLRPIKEKDSTYFLLENIDNQGEEWFPYLLSMTPFVGGWGGEWVYQPEEKMFESQMWECISAKNYSCLLNALGKKSKMPDYLISFSTNEKLNQLLIADNQYMIRYENEKYTLWGEKLE